MLSFFEYIMPLLNNINDGQKFFVMNLIIDFNKGKFMKAKVDMMKKIVYSKLWKCDTYCKIRNICLQDKWFGKVYMNQKWGSCDKNLQRLEGVVNFNSLGKGWSFWVKQVKNATILE